MKITARGSSSVTRIDKSANPGASVILGNDYGDSNIEEIKIIPVLLGKTSSGKQKQYTCPEQTAVVVWLLNMSISYKIIGKSMRISFEQKT